MFLIVGGDSEIGAATYRALKAQGKLAAATTRRPDRVAPDRPFLDLSASLESWAPPQQARAACVCAAVARIASCAADPIGTAQINVVQTSALIEKLLARGIYVLFLSTNQVFDGSASNVKTNAPYSPVSEYGRQKARTEEAVRARITRGAPAAILRLAKVVSVGMPLIDKWVTDLSAGKPINAFSDMTLAPTPTDLVCTTIDTLMENRASGIFQLTGPRDVTYAEVGRFLAAHLGADAALVKKTSASDAGLPEGATPLNTTLDSTFLRERYGFEVPDVWDVVMPVIATAKSKITSPGRA